MQEFNGVFSVVFFSRVRPAIRNSCSAISGPFFVICMNCSCHGGGGVNANYCFPKERKIFISLHIFTCSV